MAIHSHGHLQEQLQLMLNQLEDKNHHRRSFRFPAAHCSGKRVLSGERAEHGYMAAQSSCRTQT